MNALGDINTVGFQAETVRHIGTAQFYHDLIAPGNLDYRFCRRPVIAPQGYYVIGPYLSYYPTRAGMPGEGKFFYAAGGLSRFKVTVLGPDAERQADNNQEQQY